MLFLMELSVILEILKMGAAPAVASVCALWLKFVIDERNFWRKKYLDAKDQEEKRLLDRKVEQENTIRIMRKLLENGDKNKSG